MQATRARVQGGPAWRVGRGDHVVDLGRRCATSAIPIDLGGLVDTIYVSPEAPPWYLQLVQAVLARYEQEWPVRQSSLSAEPVY